jgi:hypothetical protein
MGRAFTNPLIHITVMKEKKLWYVITCHHKHELGREESFLIRMVDKLETAKKLMQGIHDEAKAGRMDTYAKYSTPKWLDESHRTLQITSDININGWLHSVTVETYHLSDEWEDNIFSNKTWILD